MFKVIYDIGANGQNIEYFLSKSKKVIALEPISELCIQIGKTFQRSVESGKLKNLNFAVVNDENTTTLNFILIIIKVGKCFKK